MNNQISTDSKQTKPQPLDTKTQFKAVCSPVAAPKWSSERLAQMPYKSHYESGDTFLAIKMPGGKWVAKCHFEETWTLFWRSVGLLDSGRKYLAKSLCNDPSWEDRPRGQRIAFGRCIKYFATHRVLPITLANPGKKGSRKYVVDQDRATEPSIH
jgi:hypothetical protein